MKYNPKVLRQQLEDSYSYRTFWAALISGQISTFSLSVNPDLITFTAVGHNFVPTTRVRISSTGGSVPGGIDAFLDYYVIDISGNNFKLSLTPDGSNISVTDTGSGALEVVEQSLDIQKDFELENWVRHEIDYAGGGRQEHRVQDALLSVVNGQAAAVTQPVQVTFIATTGSPTYRYFILIRDGTQTRMNTSGQIDQVEDYIDEETLVQNSPTPFATIHRYYNV